MAVTINTGTTSPTAVLIEGDNGIELNFSEIAKAMDGDDKLAAARAVH